jgi:hypothetical protein
MLPESRRFPGVQYRQVAAFHASYKSAVLSMMVAVASKAANEYVVITRNAGYHPGSTRGQPLQMA